MGNAPHGFERFWAIAMERHTGFTDGLEIGLCSIDLGTAWATDVLVQATRIAEL